MDLNLTQSRLGINKALSELMIGYEHAERIATYLFPVVRVTEYGGQIVRFDKSSFKRYNTRRAPGAETVQVNFGYTGEPYSLYQDAIEIPIPEENRREASNALNITLGQIAVQFLMENLTLTHELDAAAIAQNPANYAAGHAITLAPTDKFSAAGSNPIGVVDQARNTVRRKIGRKPNLMVVGPTAHLAIKNNQQIVERYQSKDNQPVVISNQMLANIFEVDMYVEGESIWVDDAGAEQDIWGNNLILAYVPRMTMGGVQRFAPAAGSNIITPSFGYTYTMSEPVMNPYVKSPRWDENREAWLYKGKYERAPLMVANEAGYLIQGVA